MFKKIKELFTDRTNSESNNDFDTKRSHHRWINSPSQFHLLVGDTPYIIEDISYGGLKVAGASIDVNQKLRLRFVNKEIEISLERVYATEESGGYRFIHNDSTLLIFLRPILENIRKGNTVQTILPEHCKAPYNSKDWTILRAEGPIDISINNQDGTLSYTFLNDKTYKTIRATNTTIKIFTSIDTEGTASRMEQSRDIDNEDIVIVIAQIQGIRHKLPNIKRLSQLSEQILKRVN